MSATCAIVVAAHTFLYQVTRCYIIDLPKTIKLVNLAFNLAATQSKQHNGHTVLPGQKGNHIPTYQMAAVIVHPQHIVIVYCPVCVYKSESSYSYASTGYVYT